MQVYNLFVFLFFQFYAHWPLNQNIFVSNKDFPSIFSCFAWRLAINIFFAQNILFFLHFFRKKKTKRKTCMHSQLHRSHGPCMQSGLGKDPDQGGTHTRKQNCDSRVRVEAELCAQTLISF